KPLAESCGTRIPARDSGARRPCHFLLEVVGMERPPVEFPVKPAQHADFGGAETFQPAIDQEISANRSGRDFLGLSNYRGFTHRQRVFAGKVFRRLRGCIESIQKLGDPVVEFSLSRVMSYRLDDSDGEAIFGAVEIKDFFTFGATFLLFPLK